MNVVNFAIAITCADAGLSLPFADYGPFHLFQYNKMKMSDVTNGLL